ncbi:MAG: family 1 glycosylhydrolase [Chthonomonas sp.]|nr:family 1 glycosylhydrolase [Chthonomonas sp.]
MAEFLWGVGSSAHQIEGHRCGRGDSVWDRFSELPQKIADGCRADIGCDHYHRFKEDILLMQDLGLNSARFSLSWPRVEPKEGESGDWAFYDSLVDEYLEAGIQPIINLFHWDFPLWAEDDGGWNDPRTPERFAAFARQAAQRLGDRVKTWLTFNEPNCFIGDGLMGTVHAPGHQWDWEKGALAIRTFFRAHGAAMQALRSQVSDVKVSIALTGSVNCPSAKADEAEALRLTFSGLRRSLWPFPIWSDPLLGGRWNLESLEAIPELEVVYTDQPPEPADFTTLNLYSGDSQLRPGHPVSAFNWPVTPEVLYWGPKFFYQRYSKPVLIGENGMAGIEWPDLEGKVEDPARVDFIRRHVGELQRAMAEGVPILGYHHWTLLDNFEWQEGFRKRFGMVYVNFETGERIPKSSFYAYQDLIRQSR